MDLVSMQVLVGHVLVVEIVIVEIICVMVDYHLPCGDIACREQMPVVFGDHIAQLAPRLDERGIDPVSRPACRSPSVNSRVTVSSSRGRGSSASGSKKIGLPSTPFALNATVPFALLEKTPGVPGLDLPGLDIASTAEGFGCRAVNVDNPDKLAEEFTTALDADGPTVIVVPTKPQMAHLG